MHFIVGLGNPGEEYVNTRHNTGRIVLEALRKKLEAPDWKEDKKIKALVSGGEMGKEKFMLIMPETFMNKSGANLASIITSEKKALDLVVIYDDLDLPIGSLKISFNRGSGGHKGMDSIIKSIKTRAFSRIRIGISPVTPSGKLKKPEGENGVIDFILGKFSEAEMKKIKLAAKTAGEATEMIVKEGKERAMEKFN